MGKMESSFGSLERLGGKRFSACHLVVAEEVWPVAGVGSGTNQCSPHVTHDSFPGYLCTRLNTPWGRGASGILPVSLYQRLYSRGLRWCRHDTFGIHRPACSTALACS